MCGQPCVPTAPCRERGRDNTAALWLMIALLTQPWKAGRPSARPGTFTPPGVKERREAGFEQFWWFKNPWLNSITTSTCWQKWSYCQKHCCIVDFSASANKEEMQISIFFRFVEFCFGRNVQQGGVSCGDWAVFR